MLRRLDMLYCNIGHKVTAFIIVHAKSVCTSRTFLRFQLHHVMKHVFQPQCIPNCELKWQAVV